MSLRLVIEHAPHPQRMTERRHMGGDLSIGRGAECDWPIEDPDMFISRRHCVISGRDGQFIVTDASRGGLFVDGADRPLGAGNSAALEHGTRLRLGDVVILVEVEADAGASPSPAPPKAASLGVDDFFASTPVPQVAVPRPEALPEPFETGKPATGAGAEAPRARLSQAFDDPFSLDPVATPPSGQAEPAFRPDAAKFAADAFWSDGPAPPPGPAQPASPAPNGFGFDDPFAQRTTTPASTPAAPPEQPAEAPAETGEQVAEPPPRGTTAAPASQGDGATLAAAFLKGAGLGHQDLTLPASPEDMEQLGRRFRLLAEGLVALLRARAKEKGSARLAQTVIGAAEVNPLKFLPTTDEALAALIAPRGRGYLSPEDAITGAFRDITDHQMRSWVAIQSALRRMIDRFDPAAFEAEADAGGLMKALLAGGKRAKLWQLYCDRYRDIARSAEDRFLGEVGADFRDAYEGNRRQQEDMK